ncbi:hypothetical protein C2845_PM04G06240 [Panicum miliaceum]|uniref:Uncharacterized protein n=1 Tax=Panicum miliaceum TaxID=4540 RepID=A0A3L6QT79_PANMI|nr:hypothetical protein C2845_PM04G06240 [Panicum miliaceum]
MNLSPKLLAVIFLLFLLGSNEMHQGPVRVAVARECQSPSHRYKGPLCARCELRERLPDRRFQRRQVCGLPWPLLLREGLLR